MLDLFNKQSDKFVFLIESRACLRGIKLSSVDTIILFDSDWDPLNDLRTLQKINIDSQFEQLKLESIPFIFILYCGGEITNSCQARCHSW